MAKGNLLLGMGRGKLGDIVLTRAYGEQISRARAKTIKNPKTTGQQVQRIILATVTKAYSQMKSIVNHSWQGVSYGANSMSKFNKLNMDYLRNQLGAYGLDNNGETPNTWAWFITQMNQLAVPNRWAISRGTLPNIPIKQVGEDGDEVTRMSILTFTGDDTNTLSYAEFVRQLGIQDGDQLTLCAIANDGTFHYGRFICSPNDGDMTANIAEPTKNNERTINLGVSINDLEVIFTLPSIEDAGLKMCAAGLILSRKSGTNWQRSNTDMIIWDMDFAGIGASMNQALYEVQTGALDFASPFYLNNANQEISTAEEGGDDANP